MPEQQIPTTYLGLFIFLMTAMWGLIAFMVRATLGNQAKTADSLQKFAVEVANHMASSNEVTRSLVVRLDKQDTDRISLIAEWGRLNADVREIKSELLGAIIKLAGALPPEKATAAVEEMREGNPNTPR